MKRQLFLFSKFNNRLNDFLFALIWDTLSAYFSKTISELGSISMIAMLFAQRNSRLDQSISNRVLGDENFGSNLSCRDAPPVLSGTCLKLPPDDQIP